MPITQSDLNKIIVLQRKKTEALYQTNPYQTQNIVGNQPAAVISIENIGIDFTRDFSIQKDVPDPMAFIASLVKGEVSLKDVTVSYRTQDLAGTDFSYLGEEIPFGMNFTGMTLTGVNFSGLAIKEANFSHVTFVNCKFDKTCLIDCDLRGANFIDNSESLPVFFECQIDQEFIEQFSDKSIKIVGIKDVDLTKININQWGIDPESTFANITINFSQAKELVKCLKASKTASKLSFKKVIITPDIHTKNKDDYPIQDQDSLKYPFINSLNNNIQFDNDNIIFQHCSITINAFLALKPHLLTGSVKFDAVNINIKKLKSDIFTDSKGNLISLHGFLIDFNRLYYLRDKIAEELLPLDGTYLKSCSISWPNVQIKDFGGAIFYHVDTFTKLIDSHLLTTTGKISKPITILKISEADVGELDKILTNIEHSKVIFKKIMLTSELIDVLKKHNALNLLQGAIVPYFTANLLDNPHGVIFDLSWEVSYFAFGKPIDEFSKIDIARRLLTWVQQNTITVNQLINPEQTSIFNDLTDLDISVLMQHKLLRPAKGQNRIALKDVLIDTSNLNLIINSEMLRIKLDLTGCRLDNVDFTKLSFSGTITFNKITIISNLIDAIKTKKFFFQACLFELPNLRMHYIFNFYRENQQFVLQFDINKSLPYNKHLSPSSLVTTATHYLQAFNEIPAIKCEILSSTTLNTAQSNITNNSAPYGQTPAISYFFNSNSSPLPLTEDELLALERNMLYADFSPPFPPLKRQRP